MTHDSKGFQQMHRVIPCNIWLDGIATSLIPTAQAPSFPSCPFYLYLPRLDPLPPQG